MVPDEVLGDIARLGLTVVTQPRFVADRGDDYLAEVDADDRPYLWRCASLIAAGIGVGFGTDAPFGDADPWRAVDAAVHRRTPSGTVLGAAERLSPRPRSTASSPRSTIQEAHRVAWRPARRPTSACSTFHSSRPSPRPSAEHVRLTLRAGQTLTR